MKYDTSWEQEAFRTLDASGVAFDIYTYRYCNVFTYAPPGNQLLLCVASIVKSSCIVLHCIALHCIVLSKCIRESEKGATKAYDHGTGRKAPSETSGNQTKSMVEHTENSKGSQVNAQV